jgi:hypothetical protein
MFNNNSKSVQFSAQRRNNRHYLIPAAIFLGISSFAAMPLMANAACNTYYVSTSGNNSALGTIDAPWRTIATGAARLKACDTLFVRNGVYGEYNIWVGTSGTATQPIQILAYPGESPVVDGANVENPLNKPFFIIAGKYVTLSGFELRNSATSAGVDFWGAYGIIKNMNIHHTNGTGIFFRGDYGLVENNTVSFTSLCNADPASPYRIAKGGWGVGITITGAGSAPASDGVATRTIVRGNTVHSVYGEGLSTYEADGTLIENNVVYDNWATNTYISDSTNVIFRNNLVYNTPNNAVGTKSAVLTLADEKATKPRSANNVVINNMFLNGHICAFCWTLVPGSGLVGDLIANNTLVNGAFATPATTTDHIGNMVYNNIFYRNDGGSVNNASATYPGISFSNNLWSKQPPLSVTGKGDIIGTPNLAMTGNTGPGQLTKAYFSITSASPVVGNGIAIQDTTDYYLVTSSLKPNIGAYLSNPPIQYLAAQ